MKVLAEAQGARGEGMVCRSSANRTTPHHTVIYHPGAFLLSLTPRHSAFYLALIVCFKYTNTGVFMVL